MITHEIKDKRNGKVVSRHHTERSAVSRLQEMEREMAAGTWYTKIGREATAADLEIVPR